MQGLQVWKRGRYPTRQELVGHSTKVNAKVFHPITGWHEKVCRDANQQFMDHEPMRAPGHELAKLEPGEASQFKHFLKAGGDMLLP
jgi:hypothetical protein